MRHASRVLVVCSVMLSLAVTPLPAGSYRVVPEESILSIVTHKAGVAAGLAHNHLVAASDYEAELTFDPASPAATRLEFRARASDLVIDSPELNQAWYPRLESLGVLPEPFEKMTDKDRKKVRETMLGRKQLDAENFPEIAGSILSVEASAEDDADFPYRVNISFEAHGRRVEREIRGRVDETAGGDAVVLEAIGDFRFTDFDIKPYSAFLGTVRNRDGLTLYVRLKAVPSGVE